MTRRRFGGSRAMLLHLVAARHLMLVVPFVRGAVLLMTLLVLLMLLVLRMILHLILGCLLLRLLRPRMAIVLGVHSMGAGNGYALGSQRRGDEQREGANDQFHVNSPVRMKLGKVRFK